MHALTFFLLLWNTALTFQEQYIATVLCRQILAENFLKYIYICTHICTHIYIHIYRSSETIQETYRSTKMVKYTCRSLSPQFPWHPEVFTLFQNSRLTETSWASLWEISFLHLWPISITFSKSDNENYCFCSKSSKSSCCIFDTCLFTGV